MWLGAAGIFAQRLLNPVESARHLDWIRKLAWLDPESGEAFPHLGFFLSAGRLVVVLVNTLILGVLGLMLARLFDRLTALVGIGLLALDPYLIGHSGLLHTDALLASLILLGLVGTLIGMQEPRRTVWWPLVGMFAGLALLTKSPALSLLAFVPLLLSVRYLLSGLRGAEQPVSGLRLLLHGSLFLGSAAITFCALHPGMWSDPVATVRTAFTLADRHLTSVQRPIFFAGRMVMRPGPAFYPLALLFRASPVALIGLMGGLRLLRRWPPERRFPFLSLLLFVALFTLGVSLGAKKHARYLLPVFPPLSLAAAAGARGWLSWRLDGRARRDRSVLRLAGLLLILPQFLMALLFSAHPLTYENPLFGGQFMASRILPSGWGEGLGAAALHLNRLPGAEDLVVAASSVPSFAPLFDGRTVPGGADTIPPSDYVASDGMDTQFPDLVEWKVFNIPSRYRPTTVYTNATSHQQADYLHAATGPNDLILLDATTPLLRLYAGPSYIVPVASMAGEDELAAWLAEHTAERGTLWLVASPGASPITAANLRSQLSTFATPASTTTVAAATIVRFIPRSEPGPEVPATPYRATFAGGPTLVDGAWAETVAWPDSLRITLRWRASSNIAANVLAVIHLRDTSGHSWASRESPVRNDVNFPTSVWAPGEWSDAAYSVRLPPGIPPDRYSVEISLYDMASGAVLGATGPDGSFRGTRVPIGNIRVDPPTRIPDVDDLSVARSLDVSAAELRLIGLSKLPTRVLSGEHVDLELFWQAEAAPQHDYRVRWRLVRSDGEAAHETVFPLSPHPTSLWRSGDRYRGHYRLHVAPDVAAGQYRLVLNLLDDSGAQVWQQGISLATIEVSPRERTFTVPDIPHRLDVTFGETIRLLGHNPLPAEIAPGETLPVTLFLQAGGPTGVSYTMFVHLLDPEGQLIGQVDLIPGTGSAPTTSWAEGQVIVQETALPVSRELGAGSYAVAVGFYDAAYGKRLSVSGAPENLLSEDRAVLTSEVSVGP